MPNKQYTIGEFAAINKISTRMLRHYDKIGLFKPISILPNGYRAYSSEQISVLSRMKQFQGCGFTLSEIESLLHADKETIAAFGKEKQMELSARDRENNSAYLRLSSLLGKQQTNFLNDYAISFTLREEWLLFLGENYVSVDQIEHSFDQLYGILDDIEVTPAGLPLLLAGEMGDAHYRTAVRVNKEMNQDGFTRMAIPQGWYLSTLHFGDYNNIGEAYDRLLCYAKEEKKIIVLPLIEQYFLDRIHTGNPNEYITEVSVKITP